MDKKENTLNVISNKNKIWTTPIYITINNKKLIDYLKVAARSGSGGCASAEGR